jgi:hypothetical protein
MLFSVNLYTGCPRRNVPDFGKNFFMLKYSDITQNTLCPKVNSYGDNGQREVWSSGGSTHCTCRLRSLIEVCPWLWCLMTADTSHKLHICFLQATLRCPVSHFTVVRYSAWKPNDNSNMACEFFLLVQFNGFMSLTLMLRALLTLQKPHISLPVLICIW